MKVYQNLTLGERIPDEILEQARALNSKDSEIVCDEDCPEMPVEVALAFLATGKRKLGKVVPVTLGLSEENIVKVSRVFGDNYHVELEKLLNKAVTELAG